MQSHFGDVMRHKNLVLPFVTNTQVEMQVKENLVKKIYIFAVPFKRIGYSSHTTASFLFEDSCMIELNVFRINNGRTREPFQK